MASHNRLIGILLNLLEGHELKLSTASVQKAGVDENGSHVAMDSIGDREECHSPVLLIVLLHIISSILADVLWIL